MKFKNEQNYIIKIIRVITEVKRMEISCQEEQLI